MSIELIEEHMMFGGWQKRLRHTSKMLHCDMTFSIYLPASAHDKKLPVLYWLSGLTCNDENFTLKAGAQRVAAELGIILVMPDTSPRGDHVPNDNAYDLGQGAGFYINATQAPWNAHFHMFDYITKELPDVIQDNFKTNGKQSIAGHSMGGHGALMLALRFPEYYESVSAFAPIVNPTEVPWGQKAFAAYLGNNQNLWQQYDSCALMERATSVKPILIDQGTGDQFYTGQLQPEKLAAIAKAKNYPLTLRMQKDYDHSYFFIASFIEDHLRFHAQFLCK